MYHYKACGLDNIRLANGYVINETASGKGVSIRDLDGLHMAIAKNLVEKKARLSPKEFRFLRIELDLSQKVLGMTMDKTDQSIAKWEKGTQDIPLLADVAIRNLYMESIGNGPVAGILSKLAQLDREIHEMELELEAADEGWHQKKEAC